MTRAAQHTAWTHAAEELVHATFPDDLGVMHESCTVSAQKQFKSLVLLANRRLRALNVDVERWRDRVHHAEEEVDFESEGTYKQAYFAFISLFTLLWERSEVYRQKGFMLAIPRTTNLVLARRREVEKTIRKWESPEWEVANERTVKWDKEQSKYLRAKLDSRA